VKILHTADWHLGVTLGSVTDRSQEQRNSLQQIADYLQVHQVEVMIVAGDLFHHQRRQQQESIKLIKEIFLPFLKQGGHIVAVTGNHDNASYCQGLRSMMDMVTEGVGRFHLAPQPEAVTINQVQFVLMPYPLANLYLTEAEMNYETNLERKQLINQGYRQKLDGLASTLNPNQPKILVGHLHDSRIGGIYGYRMNQEDEISIAVEVMEQQWNYVAYGHIHEALAIAGQQSMRYAGSIMRIDAGERDQQKSAVLLEIEPDGQINHLQKLPIACPPIYHIEIDADDLDDDVLRQRYPEADRALVQYKLSYDSNRHNLYQINRQLENVFPRCYDRQTIDLQQSRQLESFEEEIDFDNVRQTVQEYLMTQLMTDSNLAEVLQVADQLITEAVEQEDTV